LAIDLAESEAVMVARPARRRPSPYPWWFYVPAAAIFGIFFVVPWLGCFFFRL
jgi:raffinose/stachyose/melibiose transport system permease protein